MHNPWVSKGAPQNPEKPVARPAALKRRPPSREKRQIAGYFTLEEAAALRRLAVARETTVRGLMARAFNLLLGADRAEHPDEEDPTRGIAFDEAPSPRGGAAHRRYAPPNISKA